MKEANAAYRDGSAMNPCDSMKMVSTACAKQNCSSCVALSPLLSVTQPSSHTHMERQGRVRPSTTGWPDTFRNACIEYVRIACTASPCIELLYSERNVVHVS